MWKFWQRKEQKKTWEEMTRVERRIALAKDVIEQVKTRQFNVRVGFSYVGFLDAAGSRKNPITIGDRSQPIPKGDLKRIKKTCGVCARGALMLSKIEQFNHVSYGDLESGNFSNFTGCGAGDTTAILNEAFTDYELRMIERAFEKIGPDGDAHKAFGESFYGGSERLVGIMQNIIDNGGDFMPGKIWEKSEIS